VPTANRLPLLVLQHPAEAGHAKNSVRLLRLGLAACRVEVGEHVDADRLAGWLDVPGGSLLLYPDTTRGSRTPAETVATPLPRPGQLVLLDGTWRQSRALLNAHPLLQQLPRMALPAPPPSAYLHRRAHRPAQRSTLEAACLALGWLEGRPAHYALLLAGFAGWAAAERARTAPGANVSAPTDRS
jgi:DTW domain-containing protein YfiP